MNLRFCMLLLLLPAPLLAEPVPFEDSLLQVIVTHQKHDTLLPWRKSSPGRRYGYAVMVDDRHAITTEHCVRNATLLELRKARSGRKISAQVVMQDEQLNLALLKIIEPQGEPTISRRARTLVPLSVATNVPRKGKLDVLQLDETGEIQTGKAETLHVSMSNMPGAPFQALTFTLLTEVNINSEGAGVLLGNKLAGLMINYDRSSRTGDMIPAVTLRRFIDDAMSLPYNGFAYAGFSWDALVDPAKRAWLGLEDDDKGILVLSCVPGTSAFERLKPNDVILKWNGIEIDNLGFYDDKDLGRLSMTYLIKGHAKPGEEIPVTIQRDGKEVVEKLVLGRQEDEHALIPENTQGAQAEYLVDGGFFIRELSGDYLALFASALQGYANSRLTHIYLTRKHAPEKLGDRVVVLATVLPDPINIGYQNFHNAIITHVNGQPVRNIKDVFRIVDKDRHVKRLQLQSMGVELVMDEDELDEANQRLSKLYRVPKLRHQRQQ